MKLIWKGRLMTSVVPEAPTIDSTKSRFVGFFRGRITSSSLNLMLQAGSWMEPASKSWPVATGLRDIFWPQHPRHHTSTAERNLYLQGFPVSRCGDHPSLQGVPHALESVVEPMTYYIPVDLLWNGRFSIGMLRPFRVLSGNIFQSQECSRVASSSSQEF